MTGGARGPAPTRPAAALPGPTPELTRAQARQLHLHAQGLLRPPRRRATRQALLEVVARMQVLQIDTIHVVARSPYLVLFSRLGPYPPAWLDEALAGGDLFECWAHQACFAPAADYPLHRSRQLDPGRHWVERFVRQVREQDRDGLEGLLARIRETGPVKSADFERAEGTPGGWWGWKREKRWLEALFALGELMVLRREGFQRVYDLRERVLGRARAGLTRAQLPSAAEAGREWVVRAVRALGIAQAAWIADYFRTGRRYRDVDLDPLVAEGVLTRVAVRGWQQTGYVHRDHLSAATETAAGRLRATRTVLLSPFDPVVWDRRRAQVMFGFDYRLECYTPAPRRRFGYFSLPVLRRGLLVGRLDAKAHRGEGTFEVRALFLEEGIAPDETLARDLAAAIRSCADWHGTPRVVVRRSEPRSFAPRLRAALRAA